MRKKCALYMGKYGSLQRAVLVGLNKEKQVTVQAGGGEWGE